MLNPCGVHKSLMLDLLIPRGTHTRDEFVLDETTSGRPPPVMLMIPMKMKMTGNINTPIAIMMLMPTGNTEGSYDAMNDDNKVMATTTATAHS